MTQEQGVAMELMMEAWERFKDEPTGVESLAEVLGRYLGVSAKTVYRWKDGKGCPRERDAAEVVRKLERLLEGGTDAGA